MASRRKRDKVVPQKNEQKEELVLVILKDKYHGKLLANCVFLGEQLLGIQSLLMGKGTKVHKKTRLVQVVSAKVKGNQSPLSLKREQVILTEANHAIYKAEDKRSTAIRITPEELLGMSQDKKRREKVLIWLTVRGISY